MCIWLGCFNNSYSSSLLISVKKFMQVRMYVRCTSNIHKLWTLHTRMYLLNIVFFNSVQQSLLCQCLIYYFKVSQSVDVNKCEMRTSSGPKWCLYWHGSRRGGGGGGERGPVPPNILGGGPGPPNSYPATYLSQAYAIQ